MKGEKTMNENAKKYLKIGGIAAGAVVLAALVGAAFRPCAKVAMVNVEQVVANSPAIAELRAERQNEIAELQKFVEKAGAEVKKASGQKRKDLEQKYGEELAARQQQMQEKYAEQLQKVDDQMTALISDVAAENGFKLVFSKTMVVVGGVDITEQVLQKLKAQ